MAAALITTDRVNELCRQLLKANGCKPTSRGDNEAGTVH